MDIKRNGSHPSAKGPHDWFTGTVRIDSPFQGTEAARISGAIVTFEPGARTAWHTHPLGQTLIVTAGCGRAQREGGPVEEIRPGDIVWFSPNEKHWHGAAPTTAMTHIAIQEKFNGSPVDWMEKSHRRAIREMIDQVLRRFGSSKSVTGDMGDNSCGFPHHHAFVPPSTVRLAPVT